MTSIPILICIAIITYIYMNFYKYPSSNYNITKDIKENNQGIAIIGLPLIFVFGFFLFLFSLKKIKRNPSYMGMR